MTADPENGVYSRRRADQMLDARIKRIEDGLDTVDRKVDALSVRLALIGGGLAVLSFVMNIIGPFIVERIVR